MLTSYIYISQAMSFVSKQSAHQPLSSTQRPGHYRHSCKKWAIIRKAMEMTDLAKRFFIVMKGSDLPLSKFCFWELLFVGDT